jgi:hypothetical protein
LAFCDQTATQTNAPQHHLSKFVKEELLLHLYSSECP